MWLLVDGDYVNQNHVTRLEECLDGGTLIHLVGGQTMKSPRDIDQIACDIGSVVPAQPGFELLGLLKDKDYEVCRDPIIAWRFMDGDSPAALTPANSGRIKYSTGVGVLYPDGQVYDPFLERSHRDIETWIINVREWEEEEKRYNAKNEAKKASKNASDNPKGPVDSGITMHPEPS